MSLIHGMYHAKFPLLHCYGSAGRSRIGLGLREGAPNGNGIGYGYAVGTSGFAIGQRGDNGVGSGNGNGSGYVRDGSNVGNFAGISRLGHPFHCFLNSSRRYWLGRSTASPDLVPVNPIGVFLLREGFHTYPSGLI